MIKAAAISYNGKLYIGKRHSDCFKQFKLEFGTHQPRQGFVTDKDQFVDRKKAAQIALKCGQIKKLSRPKLGELFSEDLY